MRVDRLLGIGTGMGNGTGTKSRFIGEDSAGYAFLQAHKHRADYAADIGADGLERGHTGWGKWAEVSDSTLRKEYCEAHPLKLLH